jgi:hydrogenase maturation protein HypF
MVQLAQQEGISPALIRRIRIAIRGAVQGVGFRPFVYRLASEIGLPGWVLNSPQGVFIEAEGEKNALDSFLLRLQEEKPAPSFIQSLEYAFLDPVHFKGFEIRNSESAGTRSVLVLPDIAVCPDCLSEIFDPHNRRFRYPFANCTHCGPRFTIIESLPYDRPNTSMKSFEMCPDCRKEYENPENRRFHAQPNACPECGPSLQLWSPSGEILLNRDDALMEAAEAIRGGNIVAVKGLGGFHLAADAGNARAVELLRVRKHREEKPFALMYPSIKRIAEDCRISQLEARLLQSPECPIVLLERIKAGSISTIAPAVAPGNPYLGVMLPYTPLHHLLMKELGFPIIATSGNISDEPICIDEQEALVRLSGIADLFLVHNRPIVRHVDDSILRVVLGRELVLRRARGYAPLPISCKNLAPDILAVGGHLKNTIAVSVDNNIFISQHIGDLENRQASDAFQKVIQSFRRLYPKQPVRVAADAHPDYVSTKFAKQCGLPLVSIQHHFAHVAACMAENEIDGRVLGISWDGTGYGLDGSVWGGEFLLTNANAFTRAASFRRFRLPGSALSVREPRRSALGVLHEMLGNGLLEQKDLIPLRHFSNQEISVLIRMLQKGIHSPWTTSAGRLFDAVASLTGLRQVLNYEGQAAMELEFAVGSEETEEFYPFTVSDRELSEAERDEGYATLQALPGLLVDWEPLIRGILEDVRNKIPLARISKKFHNTLVEAIVAIARRVAEERVVLTGGCFQNKVLTEGAVRRLEAEGFRPYWHQRIPPNDGGIAPGQIAAASLLFGAPTNTRSELCAWQFPEK